MIQQFRNEKLKGTILFTFPSNEVTFHHTFTKYNKLKHSYVTIFFWLNGLLLGIH